MANRLLDEAGLDKRDSAGNRLLPDGRPAYIIVETTGESTLETDVMELVTDHWRHIGIAVSVRPTQRDVFRKRAMGGEVLMSVWMGMDNGVPTPTCCLRALRPPATTSCNGRSGASTICPAGARARSLTCRKQRNCSIS